MTNEEFSILDELYFTTPLEKLLLRLNWEEEVLVKELQNLMDKGWVKGIDIETENEITDWRLLQGKYSSVHYLATKKGLIAHNTL